MLVDDDSPATVEASAYYQHSKSVPFASKVSMHIRMKMFAHFMNVFAPTADDSVLDLGVTSDATQQESNYFERLYPHLDRVTCVGTENGRHLVDLYPGVTYQQITAGEPLPFSDGHFDIVFSNAVLEHAGSRAMQASFLREALRVSRRGFFVTTPDRWFPVEHHTGLPLLHYLPARGFRALLSRTRYNYWSHESNLNILTKKELWQIFPPPISGVKTMVKTIRLFSFPSNLVAYGLKADNSSDEKRSG